MGISRDFTCLFFSDELTYMSRTLMDDLDRCALSQMKINVLAFVGGWSYQFSLFIESVAEAFSDQQNGTIVVQKVYQIKPFFNAFGFILKHLIDESSSRSAVFSGSRRGHILPVTQYQYGSADLWKTDHFHRARVEFQTSRRGSRVRFRNRRSCLAQQYNCPIDGLRHLVRRSIV